MAQFYGSWRDFDHHQRDAAHAGTYSVLVSNAIESVVSSNAVLTIVSSPPIITLQPASQMVLPDG